MLAAARRRRRAPAPATCTQLKYSPLKALQSRHQPAPRRDHRDRVTCLLGGLGYTQSSVGAAANEAEPAFSVIIRREGHSLVASSLASLIERALERCVLHGRAV